MDTHCTAPNFFSIFLRFTAGRGEVFCLKLSKTSIDNLFESATTVIGENVLFVVGYHCTNSQTPVIASTNQDTRKPSRGRAPNVYGHKRKLWVYFNTFNTIVRAVNKLPVVSSE